MRYRYKATDEKGSTYKKTCKAEDKFELYKLIKQEGGTVVSVQEAEGKWNFLNFSKLNRKISSVKTHSKVIFARNLAAMINAGLPVSRALKVLARQTDSAKLEHAIKEVKSEVKKGKELHRALQEFPDVFPDIFVAMVKAGEESGKLGNSLEVVAEQMEKADQLKKKIRGAMIYPVVIVVVMIAIGILMMIYVMPTLTDTLKSFDVDLPITTKFLIATSDFMVNYKIVTFAGLVAVIGGFYGALKTQRGKRVFEFVLLRIPLIAPLVKKTNSARTARTFSSLLSSGVEVVRALTITGEVIQNSYYREVIEEAKENIQKGGAIAKAFKENDDLYPPLVGEMMSVGEETGELSEMLGRIANFYEKETSRKTDNLTSVIEPFLMVFIGAVVGFFAISVISPIYSISGGM